MSPTRTQTRSARHLWTSRRVTAKSGPGWCSRSKKMRKKVKDNFPGFTEAELTMNPKNGRNVYERIEWDLSKLEKGVKVVL